MHQIDLEQAKAELNRLLETALEGEEVVITRDEKPLLALVPVNGPQRKRKRQDFNLRRFR
jgi:antitoxin (DNA-binding transcriptional repressor) of toxin-antitoxin stability system